MKRRASESSAVTKAHKTSGPPLILGKLGSGTYGDVYAVEVDCSGLTNFAFKLTKPRPSKEEHFSETLDCIREMYGLFTAGLLRGIVSHNDNVGFLLPLCGAPIGNISVPQWPVPVVAATLRPIAEKLASTKGLHRDIKAANIVLPMTKDGQAVLIDFSLCTYADKSIDDAVTTLQYRAPEVIVGLEYGKAADIWSFGMVLFNVLLGFHFTSLCTEDYKVRHSIDLMNAFGWSEWPEYDNALVNLMGIRNVPTSRPRKGYFEFKNILMSFNNQEETAVAADLLSSILKPRPSDRLTWPQILAHPFWTLGSSGSIGSYSTSASFTSAPSRGLQMFSPVMPTRLGSKEYGELAAYLSLSKINDCLGDVQAATLKQRFFAIDHLIYYSSKFNAKKSTIFKAFRIWQNVFGLFNSDSSRPFGTEIEDLASCLLLALAYNEDFRIFSCDQNLTWSKWASLWDSSNAYLFQFETLRLMHISKGRWPRDDFDETFEAIRKAARPTVAGDTVSASWPMDWPEAFNISDDFLKRFDLFLCSSNVEELPEAVKTLTFMLAETPKSIISV